MIFKGLKDFVVDSYDDATWDRIREEAGVARERYVPVSAYPDEELVALVEAAVAVSGVDRSALLRTFGRYLLPTLVDRYGVYIEESWSGLELVENVESAIHEALRSGGSLEYEPPGIAAERVSDDVIVVTYDSERGLCDVGMGLLDGIGEHYGMHLDVYERQCMHEGAPHCEIVAVGDGTSRQRAERLLEDRP